MCRTKKSYSRPAERHRIHHRMGEVFAMKEA
jgi:hypothetical protein